MGTIGGIKSNTWELGKVCGRGEGVRQRERESSHRLYICDIIWIGGT